MSTASTPKAYDESLQATAARSELFDRYPMRLVVVSNMQSLSIYAIGALVLWMLVPLGSICYLFYCLFLEFRVLTRSCVDCYYYGRTCCFGKGRLCSVLFKKGKPERFTERHIKWFDILPDFMVTIIPILGGIIILVDEFSWTVTISMIALIGLGFPGSALVRGSLACKYCKQQDLGCPAQRLFERKKS